MLSIRRLGAEHVLSVLSLNEGATPHVAALDAAELDRLCSLSQDHLVAVDVADGRVLGYALVFSSGSAYDGEEFQLFGGEDTDSFTYVDQVVVTPCAQHRGVGRALYAALEEIACARRHGCMCCEVNILPPNPGSRAFHERLGFRAIREHDTRDGRRVVLLRKRLR